MTFDSDIHFYTLRPQQGQAHLLVVPDTEDPHCPAPSGLVASRDEASSMVSTDCRQCSSGVQTRAGQSAGA